MGLVRLAGLELRKFRGRLKERPGGGFGFNEADGDDFSGFAFNAQILLAGGKAGASIGILVLPNETALPACTSAELPK